MTHLLVTLSLLLSAEPGAASAGAPAPPAPVVVEVRADTPSGMIQAAGVEVRLVQRRMSEMGESSLERAWIATTDAQGRATFGDVPDGLMGRELWAVARWHGAEWVEDVGDRSRPTQITAYDLTTDRSSLTTRVGMSLVLSEEEMIVDQMMHIRPAGEERAVDLERGRDGLRIPLLVHAPFGEPLTWGWMPPRPNPDTTRFELQPPADRLGRLVVERGALVYRGVIPPEGIVVSAQYPVPYAEDTDHLLGWSTDMTVEALELSAPLLHGVAPEIALRRPFAATAGSTAEGQRRVLVPLTMPAPNEALLVDVHDTPSRLALVRPVTVALALAVVVLLSLLYLRTRRS